MLLFSGCSGKGTDTITDTITDTTTDTTADSQNQVQDSSILTDNNWEGTGDGSLLVCETNLTFKYYQSGEDLTDNYYKGTYQFFVGEDAVKFITEDLSSYGITEEEIQGVFQRNEAYELSNFVCLVLYNEACIINGQDTFQEMVTTPYYGFYLKDENDIYLDVANMNSGNYHTYIGK